MSDLLRLLSATLMVTAIFNIYAVGTSWTETEAVKGVRRFCSWLGAIIAAMELNYCYFLFVGTAVGNAVDTFYPLGVGSAAADLSVQAGMSILAVALLFLPFAFWLLRWRRAFYDGQFERCSPAVYHAWAVRHGELRRIGRWRDAVLELLIWLEVRVSGKKASAALHYLLILLAVMILPGVALTILSIIKLAASEHLPRHPRAGDATRGWLNRF